MVSHPAHPHPVVHWIKAELNGAGGLTADLYQTYPRAYLTAHLDDGIMEAVTTNWGNEGIQLDALGPSLVGRYWPGTGPVQRIELYSGLYFDAFGRLNYDASPLQNDITALQQQQLVDEAAAAALTTQVANNEMLIAANATSIAANATAIAALQSTLATANTQILSLQQQVLVLQQTAQLRPTVSALLAGTGRLTASLRMLQPIAANFAGAGGLTADLH